jgi:Ca-activated chloride channel family protein
MSARQFAMRSADEAPLLLEKVQVRGSIDSTLARIVMRQEYRNDTDRNVEAIYTFPLPPSAVLLRTVVEFSGKRKERRVVPKAAAEQE